MTNKHSISAANAERSRLAKIECERVFQLILQCYSEGLVTLPEICDKLNGDGHRTRGGKPFVGVTIWRAINNARKNKTP